MWDKEKSRELETHLAESGSATFPVSPSKSATGSGPELCFLNGVRGGALAGRGLSRLLGVQDGLSKHFNAVCCCLWMTHYILIIIHSPCEPLRPVILLHDSHVELSNERQSWSITGLNGWQGLWVDDHSEKLLAPPRRLCFLVCLSICLCVCLLTASLKNNNITDQNCSKFNECFNKIQGPIDWILSDLDQM